MKILNKRVLFLLLAVMFACSLMAALYACGGDSDAGGGTGGGGGDTPGQQQGGGDDAGGGDEPYVDPYEYPDIVGSGQDFKFYNVPENVWFYYTDLAFDEPPADVLDDAIYKRNRFIEEKFNINIVEINMPGTDMWEYNAGLRRLLTAGDDVYDAVFMPASFNGTVGAMLTEGLFHDLRDISTIDLDQDYWNQTMLKEAAIGTRDKIFYAGSGINIFTLQAGSYVYFNQDIMQDIGQDLPYNLVREGKWTFDVYQQYIKEGTRLNGATDFTWDQSGSAIYGMVGYENSSTSLLIGANERLISTDNDGRPVVAIGGERFTQVLTRIGEILNPADGSYLYANDSDHIFHYENIFRNGRGLFTIGELKAANVFRDMEATFGVLPLPKFNESQQEYTTLLINQTPVLVIPHTNDRTELTGAVLDALAYVSNRDVTPVLFDVAVSQKQLRNEESIEMLEYTKNKGSFEIGIAYGWTNPFYDSIRTTLGEGKAMNIASEIERRHDNIVSNIAKTMERFD